MLKPPATPTVVAWYMLAAVLSAAATVATAPHRHPLLRNTLPAGVTLSQLWPDPGSPPTSTHGKPGLGQLGDGLLLAISGGIADYRCFNGAMIKRSTNGGRTWGEAICAIPADWAGKGWCVPPKPTPNVSTYGIGNTHDGPVIVGHTATNSTTLLFDCIPNTTSADSHIPSKGEQIWAVRSTDAGLTFGEPWQITPSLEIPPGRGKNGA